MNVASSVSVRPSRPPRFAAAILRVVLRALVFVLYRLDVRGAERVPATGGVLLAPNHVTYVDGLLLQAALGRPVRFLVERAQFEKKWLAPFLRALDCIPVSASGGPRDVLRALRDAGAHLSEGHVVCIFPEGQLTRTGTLQAFRRGIERIAHGRGAPIVPVHLDRAWGSLFSFARGRFLWKLPQRIPYPVSVEFGAPLPDSTPVALVRERILDLAEVAWRERNRERAPLHRDFVRSARLRPWRFAIQDAVRGRVSRLKLAAFAVVLARALRERWRNEDAVGVLLPPSVAGAAVNLAAALAGRPSVHLNYTAGRAALESAARQAGLASVVTSRAFLEKAKVDVPGGVALVHLEDLAPRIGSLDRFGALLAALLLPLGWLERWCGARRSARIDDVVTILFSSGSTGEPKGVPLTHANLASNVAGVAQVFETDAHDRLLGILPLFHSFGCMSTWFALNHGIGIVAHPNPLDAAAVGGLVEKERVTLLIATPTFLALYMKRCAPEQLGSLRIVLTGAEKLSPTLADAFQERFGIRPIEGYGATECAPVIATSVPSVREPGIFQAGARRGSVGQPLPGITVRIVDPDTYTELAPGTPGMLLVRGANVMSGYLGRPDLTAQVLRDGWYVTGDVALLDHEGFLRITDRLARFSKIGGEMVPHGRVEEALHQAAGVETPTFAVTSLPDEKKGERLAVLHTLDAEKIAGVLAALPALGLPNLFVPRADAFVKVDALPVLGTGKLDLKRVKEIARERLASG